MGLIQLAKMEQKAVKAGAFGPGGSGKTTTLSMMLIGLSLTYHQGAGVVFFDTEGAGSDFVKPIFDVEGIPFFNVKSQSFKDMRATLAEAEQLRDAKGRRPCGLIVDSYTHPWQELQTSLAKKLGVTKLLFPHMQQLKAAWTEWVNEMLASELHILLSGRLGSQWDNQENEDGRSELVRLGSKMKGETDAGYEPNLLFEMEALAEAKARERRTRKRQGAQLHHCYVTKDRARALNGLTFTFKDLNGYKKGDYRKVFDAFTPHFDFLAIGQGEPHRTTSAGHSSASMFDQRGNAEWSREQQQRAIAAEEVKELIAFVWPGQDAISKRQRQLVLEQLFGTFSWTRVEASSLETLERAARILKELRNQVRESRDRILKDAGIVATLDLCKQLVEAALEPEPVM